jgi:hypothetical protein
MTFAKKPVKIKKKQVKTDVRGTPLPVPHGPTRVNPLAPKVVPGKPGVPARLAPKPKVPTPQDVGIPGVHPHQAAARSTQLPGAVVKPIAHPGKLKGKTPIKASTGKAIKTPPPIPADDNEPGMNTVMDEVQIPFDPAEEYKVMSEWFASAGWAGAKLKPGEPLPEWDDGQDD